VQTRASSGVVKGVPQEIEAWAVWAESEADRIDPVLSGRFLDQLTELKDDDNDTTRDITSGDA
jgi:hypothetical protein